LIKDTLERGVKLCPKKEIVCRELPRAEMGLPIDFRYTYSNFYERVCQVANMLAGLGVRRGDIVTTFAHNSHRHLELSFATPMMGAIFEPLTIALPKEVNINMLNRFGQRLLFIDEGFIPLFEGIKDELRTVNTYVVMTDKKELPQTKLPNAYSYEELMAKASTDYTFPEDLDEDSPALLGNTTGTTGPPKAFMHSHRSIFTHCLTLGLAEGLGINSKDVVMDPMPLWYFNGWNFTYAAALYGAKLVIPSSPPKGEEIGELIEREKVTFVNALSSWVTEWAGIWEKGGWKYNLSSVDRMICAASPRAPIAALRNLVEKTGLRLVAGNGFSEACPLVSVKVPESRDWADQEKVLKTDGIPGTLIKWKVVNPKGEEVKHDGKEIGMLAIKGTHVVEEYYKDPEATAKNFDDNGYFYSGDMTWVDEEGYTRWGERVEDLIRTEEGYIPPSVLEGVIGELPSVLEAAAIGAPRGEFERPLVCVVLREEHKGKITEQGLRKEFEGKVPELWIPEVVIIEEMPRGATGKYDKRQLKKRFKGE
jgi:fatty-acyl-CoA synthase